MVTGTVFTACEVMFTGFCGDYRSIGTGTDKDYDAYKEALNAATNEVRKSKRNFEHKLAQNIKSDSKSF